jgi:GntR family transcriptional regulator/MocR family aminotransferase
MDLIVALDGNRKAPLHKQLYDEIRGAILAGRLGPGHRVPSTREMAKSLGVSRTTVTQSYDELLSEGYLEAVVGSGTFVCKELPEELLRIPASKKAAGRTAPATRSGRRLSEYGSRLKPMPAAFTEPEGLHQINFTYGVPDLALFPIRQWSRLVSRHSRAAHRDALGYVSDNLGYWPLREAIAAYLGRARAVRCSAGQVFIVNGSQQALDLISRVLLDKGDIAATEEPGYPGARLLFQAHGASICPVPVDDQGLQTAALSRVPAGPKLIYITPSHQFPLGVGLSLGRRLELLAWAERQSAIIIEDDYCSEYRYANRPNPSLQGLDQAGSVIYVGTFSKIMYPGLRMAYMVAPADLLEALSRAKWLADRQSPMLEQYAMADFIDSGWLERHVRRMRLIYGGRREALVGALREYLGDCTTIVGDRAGMHLIARVDSGRPDDEIVRRARGSGVELGTSRRCYLGRPPHGEFMFGFAALGERLIREGVRRIQRALKAGRTS